MAWQLPDGYVERDDPCYFFDTMELGFVSQPDVYPHAASIAQRIGARSLVDLGCGQGVKLAGLALGMPHLALVGVDHGPNIEACRSRWFVESIRWVDFDLELGVPHLPELASPVVAVCADVLEHLRDPGQLLHGLQTYDAVVLSTPERNLEHGSTHRGPPVNDCHVREWSQAELLALLADYGMPHATTWLTRSDDRLGLYHTTIAEVIR